MLVTPLLTVLLAGLSVDAQLTFSVSPSASAASSFNGSSISRSSSRSSSLASSVIVPTTSSTPATTTTQATSDSTPATSSSSDVGSGGGGVVALGNTVTSTETTTVPITTTISGRATTQTAVRINQVIVVVNLNGQRTTVTRPISTTVQTLVTSTVMTTAPLSTIFVTETADATADAASTSASPTTSSQALPDGAAVSTSQVVVVVDRKGNTIGPNGQATQASLITSTSMILVTLRPSTAQTTSTRNTATVTPQLVSQNSGAATVRVKGLSAVLAGMLACIALLVC